MSADLPPPPEDIDYIARWEQIVRRRQVQMDTAYAQSGLKNVDYWGRRAKQYRAALHTRMEEDPFLVRVRNFVQAADSVLDVGAGTGRHTLALAPHVAGVTAIDPSPAMLSLLRQDVESAGIKNVHVIESGWLDAPDIRADVVICSHVLYPIAEPVPFIRKLEASAARRVFLYIRTDPLATDIGLWSEFYGVPLQAQPTQMDLVNLLYQAGIAADVEVVRQAFSWTWFDLDEAVGQIRNALCLPEGDPATDARLRTLVEERLAPGP
ncbi:MAG: class I SAM-dependent methyltransferase, partial [Chloroflexi bacterium]|nr:class I SAM-dependent methyltransferase [Chloroflexota bacterium]